MAFNYGPISTFLDISPKGPELSKFSSLASAAPCVHKLSIWNYRGSASTIILPLKNQDNMAVVEAKS